MGLGRGERLRHLGAGGGARRPLAVVLVLVLVLLHRRVLLRVVRLPALSLLSVHARLEGGIRVAFWGAAGTRYMLRVKALATMSATSRTRHRSTCAKAMYMLMMELSWQ